MALPTESKTFADLNAVSSENDSDFLALQQGNPPAGGVSPTPTRKWSLTQLIAWIKSKLGTAATVDTGTGSANVLTGAQLASENYLKFSGGSGLQNTNGTPGAATDFPVEEGTWTPVLEGIVTAGSHSYSNQDGYYHRQGNILHCTYRVTLTAKDGAAAGDALIRGLPFQPSSESGNVSEYSAPVSRIVNWAPPANFVQLHAAVVPTGGINGIRFNYLNDSETFDTLTVGDIDGTFDVLGSFTVFI